MVAIRPFPDKIGGSPFDRKCRSLHVSRSRHARSKRGGVQFVVGRDDQRRIQATLANTEALTNVLLAHLCAEEPMPPTDEGH